MNALRIASIAVLLFVGAVPAYSVDVSLGASTWYVWWTSSLEGTFRGEDNKITAADPINNSVAYNDLYESDPHFMAGPILNLKFSERWSLGFVMLMSQWYAIESAYNVKTPGDTLTSQNYTTLRRYDGDLTVNYRIGSGWGFFCGFKYFRWEGTGIFDVLLSSGTYSFYMDSELLGQALGPAAGMSYSSPLAGMLFFTASASGIYMKSNVERTETTTIPAYEKNSIEDTPYFIGFNGMAGLGYSFPSLRSTLIIGARYQYLKMEDSPRDLFYGVTATVMYHF